MERKKIVIKSKERTICLSDLEGTFSEAINQMIKWKEFYESFCEDGEFCLLDYDYDWDNERTLYVKYYRYELDEELKQRLDKEALLIEQHQQQEIEQLRMLKEKYKHLDT